MFCLELLNNAENIVFAHDQIFFAFDFNLGTGLLSEEDAVAFFDFESDAFAIIAELAISNGDDLAFGRFLLGSVGDNDSAFGCLLFLNACDQNSVL
jgi:hypothetical protein